MMIKDQKMEPLCMGMFSLFFIILMTNHLMLGLLSGLITYTLIIKLDLFLSLKIKRFSNSSKLISVLFISLIIMLILIGGTWYILNWFITLAKHPNDVIEHTKNIMDTISTSLPASISNYIPDNLDEIKKMAMSGVKEHLAYIKTLVNTVARGAIIIIIGLIIGLILGYQTQRKSIEQDNLHNSDTPLIFCLKNCLNRLVTVFYYVVISQIVIALINATMTAIFLFIILPLFGIHIPFAKSLVLATFLFGLIPIIGNFIVNSIMFCVGITISLPVAIAILIYLIVIHKIEYILNAKIVGSKVHSGIAELLIAMIFLETLFGFIGLVFAPIFYAFIKLSLKDLKLI